MKLGICLVGISHLIHDQRWPISRSYLDCKDNYTEELLKPLAKFDIKVYLTSYLSSETGNIIDFYKPEACQFLNLKNSHQIKTFIKSIELIEDEKLDYVMFTRFDIFFNKGKLKELNFDLNKFNFLCREKDHWDDMNFVNDCVYFLPFAYLLKLKKACITLLSNPPRPGLMDMHGLYKSLINFIPKEGINFLTDEHFLSSKNSIYDLKRRNN